MMYFVSCSGGRGEEEVLSVAWGEFVADWTAFTGLETGNLEHAAASR